MIAHILLYAPGAALAGVWAALNIRARRQRPRRPSLEELLELGDG